MSACEKCVFAVHDDNPHCGLRGFRSDFNVEWCEAENDKAPNGYELQEDGYFSWVHKKKEYPKTYEECRRIMDIDTGFLLTSYDLDFWKGHLLTSLQKLLICRDAYWKLYGDEMGLGKPWEPDWLDDNLKPCIGTASNEIIKCTSYSDNTILAFPTKEMRDAFYENFKELIESVKELL